MSGFSLGQEVRVGSRSTVHRIVALEQLEDAAGEPIVMAKVRTAAGRVSVEEVTRLKPVVRKRR